MTDYLNRVPLWWTDAPKIPLKPEQLELLAAWGKIERREVPLVTARFQPRTTVVQYRRRIVPIAQAVAA